MAITPNEKKDLRAAWNHLFAATEALEKFKVQNETFRAPVLTAQQEISDAKRLIDRVEQERMPGVPLDLRVKMIKEVQDQISLTHAAAIPEEWAATVVDAAIRALNAYKP